MDATKSFLILIFCILQIYTQARPVDIKTEIAYALVDYVKQVTPFHQSYIDEVKNGDHKPDGGAKYIKYQHNVARISNELGGKIDKILKNIKANNPSYEKDQVDNLLVNTFKEWPQQMGEMFATLNNMQPPAYEGYILRALYFFSVKAGLNEDFGNPIFKYFNDCQLTFEKFRKSFEEILGLEIEEKILRFEELMADVSVELNKVDEGFVDFYNVLD